MDLRSRVMDTNQFMAMSKSVPLKKRPQIWWDTLSVLGGVAVAVLWFIYAGIRSGREGFDLITPLLMIAMPLGLMYFRTDIDTALQPLQPARRQLPRIVLAGLGLAVPFLMAFILYNIFNISQYPLMQATIILGTLVSYAIVREPEKMTKKPPGKQNVLPVMVILLVLLCCIAPAVADDCLSDPLNARDCLRTDGYAEVIAGLFSALLGGLVNGPIILQGLNRDGENQDEEDDDDDDDDDDEEEVSIVLTYPAGYSPKVFTHGWVFGARATVGDKDLSDKVQWSGTATFNPAVGSRSHPSFAAPGPNQITLSLETENGVESKNFTIEAVSPSGYARVGSQAQCPADAHGCPACPHTVVGPIQTGSSLIRINGLPAARIGDSGTHAACCGSNQFTITGGDPEVLIEGRPAARIGDTTRHCGGYGHIIG
jgi:uncharacterized Zn-binding protein involved in type VI secretion